MKMMHAFLIALLLASTSGCACWKDEAKKNSVGCVVLRDLVDCTTTSLKEGLPYFVQIVGGLISGGLPTDQIPWDEMEKQAAAMGIKDGACFLAELKNLVFSAPKASPQSDMKLKMVADTLDDYKLKHLGSRTVKIKFVDRRTGKTVVM